jgi:tetratricopeptide (TPR) repeat protein
MRVRTAVLKLGLVWLLSTSDCIAQTAALASSECTPFGTTQKIISACSQLIGKSPNSTAFAIRGSAYRLQRNYGLSLADLDKAISLDSKNTFAISRRGVTKTEMGIAASDDWDRVLAVSPVTALDHEARGIAFSYASPKNIDGAIHEYSKAIEIDPKLVSSYLNRGFLTNEHKHSAQTIDDFEKVVELTPSYAFGYFGRGMWRLKQNDIDRAVTDFQKFKQLDPEYAAASPTFPLILKTAIERQTSASFDYCVKQGKQFLAQESYDKAIAEFNKALEISQSYGFVYDLRGQARMAKSELELALADFSKAIELDPQYPTPYFNRSKVFTAKNDAVRAAADQAKGRELSP